MLGWLKNLFGRGEPGVHTTMFVPQELWEKMGRMRDIVRLDCEHAVICHALATYDYLLRHEVGGARLFVERPGGERIEFSIIKKGEV